MQIIAVAVLAATITITAASLQSNSQWHVLGPLPVSEFGTGGTDPLLPYGQSIFNATTNTAPQSVRLVSELVADGQTIDWKSINATTTTTTITADTFNGELSCETLSVDFSEQLGDTENARRLNNFYGQRGLAWQAWAVGRFNVSETGWYYLAVSCSGCRLFFLAADDLPNAEPHISDPYSAPSLLPAVRLERGAAKRLLVPLNGQSGQISQVTVCFRVQQSPAAAAEFIETDALIPDAVNGRLVSPYVSVVIRVTTNADSLLEGLALTVHSLLDNMLLLTTLNVPKLQPAQIFPVTLRLPQDWLKSTNFTSSSIDGKCTTNQLLVSLWGKHTPPHNKQSFHIQQSNQDFSEDTRQLISKQILTIRCRGHHMPFRFTFPDKSDGSLHKAAAYPPQQACRGFSEGCPVVVALHGASVEADSDEWTMAFRQQMYSWIFFPTNRRPFGFDWESPGWWNVQEGLQYFANQLVPHVSGDRDRVDISRRLYAGHSMGGHGCLLMSTLHPDQAMGSACASGWIRRDLYAAAIPLFSTGASRIDHQLMGLMQSSLDEYSPDFHLRNMVGVPVLLRTGSADDNVPAWGFRRIARMLNEYNSNQNWTILSEIPGKGHWFDGIMNDDLMHAFFSARIHTDRGRRPPLPLQFTLTTINPATFGSRGGMRILQLCVPYRKAGITVRRLPPDLLVWRLSTTNVQRFQFISADGMERPNRGVEVDGQGLEYISPAALDCHYYRNPQSRRWNKECTDDWRRRERSPTNYGPARQILSSGNPIKIVYGTGSPEFFTEALFISQTLYYQGRFSIQLVPDTEYREGECGDGYSVIFLGKPLQNLATRHFMSLLPENKLAGFEDNVNGSPAVRLSLTDGPKVFSGMGIGTIFLAPLWNSSTGNYCTRGLALIVAANSPETFSFLARHLTPLSSHVMMGDYMVVDQSVRWQGYGGILSFGFWNNHWQADERIGWIHA